MRVEVTLTGEVEEALDRLTQTSASKYDAIRKAISVGVWVNEMRAAGNKILIEDREGRMREVFWPI